jgi:hypothetical protein
MFVADARCPGMALIGKPIREVEYAPLDGPLVAPPPAERELELEEPAEELDAAELIA